MNEVSNFVRISIKDRIASICMDVRSEKMNIISPKLIDVFNEILDDLENNQKVDAIVLISGKKDFIAGADIKAFKADNRADFLPIVEKGHAIMNRIELGTKPMVAAITGTCYGLGTELSLACRARICSDEVNTKIALPEVKLGLLPGAGGTQRLPKLIGISKSLDMMLTGKNIFAQQALKIGLVDELVNINKLHDAAIQLAKKIVKNEFKRTHKKTWLDWFLDKTFIGNKIVFSQARKSVQKLTQGNYPAPFEIINCVKYGSKKSMNEGLNYEANKFIDLMMGDVSKSLINLFFSMTENKKNPYDVPFKSIKSLGIIGTGFMGAGIAEITMDAKIPVKVYDLNEKVISNAKASIWNSLKNKITKRIIQPIDAEKIFSTIQVAKNMNQLVESDIIIEAVVEKMEVKKSIIVDIESAGKESLIIASNTSSLSITEMTESAIRKDKIIGMHYFSPVPKMPLLEIVKTKYTSDSTIAACYELGIKQGKTCIVVKDSPGFYVNRILSPYLNECLLMLEEGISIDHIDKALSSKGFPVGPLKLIDEVGIDIVVHATNANKDYASKRKGYSPNHGLEKMFLAGFLGKKNKKGFYIYDDKTGKSKGVNHACFQFFNSKSKIEISNEEICDRAIFLMLKEAKMCLSEEIISNEEDGNLGAIFGIGFLPYTGGPFSMINRMGIDNFENKLSILAKEYGDRFLP